MSKWKDQRAAEAKKEAPVPTLEELEAGFKEDFDELHNAFRDRAAKEQKRFMDVCDTGYYFTVCFSNRDQLIEFCESVGLDPDNMYMDGREFAKRIKRALKTPDTEYPKTQPFARDYVNRSMER